MKEPTQAELRALWKVCREWVEKTQVSAPESIYQMDNVQEALPELGEKVTELVGYYEDPE